MKKYILYKVAAVALLFGQVSCGDAFLSEEPSSSLPIDGYYNTSDHILESAVAAYDPMQWYDGDFNPMNLLWDCMSDDVYVGGSSTSDSGHLHLISQFRSDPRNTVGGFWSANYSGINRSIRLIDNAKKSDLPENEKNLYVAEGRALRAWYYLCLWKTWGNIPFYMENLEFPYVAEQKTPKDVYNIIVADLEEVLEQHILPMKQPDALAGRMTQATASMIYAEFVMYQNDESRYPKALEYMQDIIDSGQYQLVDGSDYDNLFAVETEWNQEIIWDINYYSNANASDGTMFPTFIGIAGLRYENAKGTTVGPLTEFNSGGWGFGPVAKEAYDAFEEGDLRRDIAILNMDKYIKEMANNGVVVAYDGRYQNTGFFMRKYLGRPNGRVPSTNGDSNWENNKHIYRYAETLLNAAELGLATGDVNAQSYFDEVRERAGVAPKLLTLDNIIDERRLEFVGEGKRYFDLVRTGKASTILKQGGGVVLKDKENMVWGGSAIPERVDWTESKKYIPIPQDEIEASRGAIKQNPY